jgi:hypothetical protein
VKSVTIKRINVPFLRQSITTPDDSYASQEQKLHTTNLLLLEPRTTKSGEVQRASFIRLISRFSFFFGSKFQPLKLFRFRKYVKKRKFIDFFNEHRSWGEPRFFVVFFLAQEMSDKFIACYAFDGFLINK